MTQENAARMAFLRLVSPSMEARCNQLMDAKNFEELDRLVLNFGDLALQALAQWKQLHTKLMHPTIINLLTSVLPSTRPGVRRAVMDSDYPKLLEIMEAQNVDSELRDKVFEWNRDRQEVDHALTPNGNRAKRLTSNDDFAYSINGSWGTITNEDAVENLIGKGRANSKEIEKTFNCKLFIQKAKGNSPARYHVKANSEEDFIGAMTKAIKLLEINQTHEVTIEEDSVQADVTRMREKEFLELQQKYGVHIDRMPGKKSIIYGWLLVDAENCYKELKPKRGPASPLLQKPKRRVNFT